MPNTCNDIAIPELFFVSGMARGINPCLAPGDKMDSPITINKYAESH